MAILCGTDFSEHSTAAVTAAAHLAMRMQLPLHVLHSVESPVDPTSGDATSVERRLNLKVERLRELGAQVIVHVLVGPPDETLLALAREIDAQLIIVGALGHRAPGRWQVGGHADRLAQRTHVPVLAVRNSEPFRAWARLDRPLRVTLGADLSRSTDAAMGFIQRLCRFAPCNVTAVHLYWPPQHFARLGLGGVRSYLDPDPEVTKTLVRELEERLTAGRDGVALQVRVEPHLGRPGDRLAMLADQDHADLVVVGTHDRDVVGRLWEGSVSRGVLHCAGTSVACVPLSAADGPGLVTRIRSVLIATDFSSVGNAAVSRGYSLLEPGGTAHLVHVIAPVHPPRPLDAHDIFPPQSGGPASAQQQTAAEQLRRLVPANATEQHTQFHILESYEPARAICQAAERLGVDVLCLGTRGRSGLARTVLGSVAQSVLAHSERPVLLAHQPRD